MNESNTKGVAILDVADLSHRYTKDWALRDVGLSVTSGGVIGLLGSNGAGKSTFMNIVAGCLSQTQGTVVVDGLDVRQHPLASRRRIGFLPQQAPLSFELTIDEYLRFCAGLRGVADGEIDAAVDFVVDRCGLSPMRRRLISNLSGGYRQRVGIAQALVHRPPLIILDEPTVGLDPNQIRGVRALIAEIGQEHTVLFSTHILSEVEMLCRDVMMIERGEIVFHGEIDSFRNTVTPSALVLVSARPPEPEMLQAELNCVTEVERVGPAKLRIAYNGGRDIVEALISLGRGRDWGIDEIYFEKSSLEDVFGILSQEETNEAH